jgi:hypothetical protein
MIAADRRTTVFQSVIAATTTVLQSLPWESGSRPWRILWGEQAGFEPRGSATYSETVSGDAGKLSALEALRTVGEALNDL